MNYCAAVTLTGGSSAQCLACVDAWGGGPGIEGRPYMAGRDRQYSPLYEYPGTTQIIRIS